MAIEIGLMLAVFLFMHKMITISNVSTFLKDDNNVNTDDANAVNKFKIPDGVEVFELSGPMFFGAAYKFKDAIKVVEKKPRVLIVRMRHVPIIDATGLHTIKDVLRMCHHDKIQLIISELQPQVLEEFKKSRLLFQVGKRYVADDFGISLQRAAEVIHRSKSHG
jgi:SulP family sulfate permease